MTRIVLITKQPEKLRKFCQFLEASPEVSVQYIETAADALNSARQSPPPSLMVIDHHLGGNAGLSLAAEILSINAWIHVAMISDLPSQRFHQDTEGLGILMQLPPDAGEQDAMRLLEKLAQISNL